MAKEKKLVSIMSKRQAQELDEILGEIENLRDMFEEIGDNEPSRASLMYKSGHAYAQLLSIRNRLNDLGTSLSGDEIIVW